MSPYTASASELLAVSLKRLAGALIVGERTFGKCASQRAFNVSNGDVISFTNAWFESGGSGQVVCDARGIKPDITLDLTFASAAEVELELIAIRMSDD